MGLDPASGIETTIRSFSWCFYSKRLTVQSQMFSSCDPCSHNFGVVGIMRQPTVRSEPNLGSVDSRSIDPILLLCHVKPLACYFSAYLLYVCVNCMSNICCPHLLLNIQFEPQPLPPMHLWRSERDAMYVAIPPSRSESKVELLPFCLGLLFRSSQMYRRTKSGVNLGWGCLSHTPLCL